MTFDDAVRVFGHRLGLAFEIVKRADRLEQVEVRLNGSVVGRVYGNPDDGFVFQMALLPDDQPGPGAP